MPADPAPDAHPIDRLRAGFVAAGIDGFLIPRADRHQGESVPASEERLAFATGFTGSAGLAIVLRDKAALFVDGRYGLQAATETAGAPIDVVPLLETPPDVWLKAQAPAGARIGYDPWLHTRAQVDKLSAAAQASGATLAALADNPVDAIWTTRPARPVLPAFAHPEAVAGQSAADKRQEIAAAVAEAGAAAAVVTSPDGVNWLLNIRGGDLATTPVLLAFALVRAEGRVQVFTDPAQVPADVADGLGPQVNVEPWEAFAEALDGFAGATVLVDRDAAPMAVSERLTAAGAKVTWKRDLTALPRARFTEAETAGARAAHRRDGAALVSVLAWIEETWAAGGALSESAVSDRLTAARQAIGQRAGEPLLAPSFDPIVGFRDHGAIVHYRVSPETDRAIAGDGVLLLDSGGHYTDGTTDVTRTVALGAVDPAARAAATLVLKGMIAISRLRFPVKTSGRDLDAFARAALWTHGLDYDHGTGHGVGSVLGVHDGPQSLSKRGAATPLEAGMVLSNEPGFYATGAFGIRIENLVLVEPASVERAEALSALPPARAMHAFETLTLVPIDRRLVDPTLLDASERAWLDAYHARVLAEVGPLLDAKEQAWLAEACAPLTV